MRYALHDRICQLQNIPVCLIYDSFALLAYNCSLVCLFEKKNLKPSPEFCLFCCFVTFYRTNKQIIDQLKDYKMQ